MDYFELALSKEMTYEVGGFWNLEAPGVRQGLIDTPAQRRAVGLTNDPNDRGGVTKYGIAQNANPNLDVLHLDWEGAKRVYIRSYWNRGDCQFMVPPVAIIHFDGCINHGVSRAATILQNAVGTKPDGDIGPATLAALNALSPSLVVNKICDLRVAFYNQIVANNSSQGKFLNGWLRRVNEMRQFALSLPPDITEQTPT